MHITTMSNMFNINKCVCLSLDKQRGFNGLLINTLFNIPYEAKQTILPILNYF